MRTLLCCLILAASSSFATAAERWTQFRGPGGTGLSDATGLPVEWSETHDICWKTVLPGKAWSSPVVWDDQVWATNATEDGKRLSAVCLDRQTGEIVRDVLVFAIEKPQFCYPFNSYASSTPVIEAGRIYVHYGSHGTACLDTADGHTIWARQDLPCDHFRGAGSSPIVFGDLVFLTFDGADLQYVAALDKHTGETVWRTDREIDYGTDNGDHKKAFSTPTIVTSNGKPQLVSPAAAATIAYDPLTGEGLWKVHHGGMNAAAPPLVGLDLLFVNTGDGGFKQFAVRLGGRGDVTESRVVWKVQQGVPSRCAPLLIDDLLYMLNEAGIVTCLDARSGEVVWKHRLGGNYSSSPVAAEGRIYLNTEDGESHVIAVGRKFKLLATNHLDAGCMATPAIAGKALFHRTKTHLYRIEEGAEAAAGE
ncbi:MAG TPA: PQQ-binding-like beta-propeller repeat protein [Pirellulales bacterium]|nr:PQQ-binding-like beta-propeller repeat protein [Pirellulales bacterium]